MPYKIITEVATEPVTLAEAKLHLRVDGSDEDTLITALITAAREYAEHYTQRALAEQTLEVALDEFPCDDFIDLDMGPVSAISSIKYTDTNGVEQTFSSASYSLDTYGDARRVNLAYGSDWPDTRDEANAVRVRYVTGYSTIPTAAKSAILLLLGHLYENRQDATSMKLESIPTGACALLNTIKVWGF